MASNSRTGSASAFGRAVLLFGILAFFHAAYSTYERESQHEAPAHPLDQADAC